MLVLVQQQEMNVAFNLNPEAKWDSRMAIPQERFVEVRDTMCKHLTANAINEHAVALQQAPRYQAGGEGDLSTRVRWDCYWSIRRALNESDTDYTDKQLDSALRRIVVEA